MCALHGKLPISGKNQAHCHEKAKRQCSILPQGVEKVIPPIEGKIEIIFFIMTATSYRE